MDETENRSYRPTQSFPPPARKDRTWLKVAAVALCFSLLGGSLGAGGVVIVDRLASQVAAQFRSETDGNALGGGLISSGGNTILQEGNRENTVIDITKVDTDKLMSAAEVYAVNVNSTVGITTSITTNFWGHQTTSAASGSGFVISEDGYILTNFHVIEDSDSISVSTFSGNNYDAMLIGYDERNDIAVLKIDAQGLRPVILGNSDNLNVGDEVVAIGNPLGELTFSLTGGAISAKDREVTFSDGITMKLLQTDCAINSGNSGGALFNLYGEVIGVTNAKYSSSGAEASIDNIGFAIPINSVRGIVESIIEKGYVAKPYLGVAVMDVSESYQIYGLPAGAAIQSVEKDSPAEDAGLKIGDIITKAGDAEISGASDLTDVISRKQPGDVLELTVYRRGQTLTVTVTVGQTIQYAND